MKEEIGLEELAPWLALVITLIGGLLRVVLLSTKGMWLDETFSVWLASHSVREMLEWTARIDQHPPLYYLLLHYWIGLRGNTPYDVRLLSVLFGIFTTPIIYLIGKRISGEAMGLAAAAFLALSTFHVYFAQETRMYTLLTFNAAVAIYALVRLLSDPRSTQPIGSQFRDYLHAWRTAGPLEPNTKKEFSYRDETRYQTGWKAWIFRHHWSPIQSIETDLAWLACILFSAATLLTHNTAVFFLAATNIFVLGLMWFQKIYKSADPYAFHAPSFRNWAKSQLAILLLWSPWIPSFIKQASTIYQRFWIPAPTWDAVLFVLKSFLNASAPMPAGRAIVVWSLYAVVLCLGVVHYRKNLSRFLFLAALFAIPFLGELIVSIWRPIFRDRTLIWTTIPLFLLLAAGIAQLRHRFLMVAVIGILGTINLFSTGDYYRFFEKEDWNTPAGYVANFAKKGDLVLFNSNVVEIPFDYYFQPFEELYSLQLVKQGVPLDLFDDGVLEPMMTTNDIPGLISVLNGHDRVWLVYSHDSYTDPMGLTAHTLASQKNLVRTRDFRGGQVQLYESP